MKILSLAAGLALIAFPANAAVQPAQSNAAAVNAAAQTATSNAPAKSAKADKETRYCLTYEAITGSRIGKTECKTRAEWDRAGIDIDELAAK